LARSNNLTLDTTLDILFNEIQSPLSLNFLFQIFLSFFLIEFDNSIDRIKLLSVFSFCLFSPEKKARSDSEFCFSICTQTYVYKVTNLLLNNEIKWCVVVRVTRLRAWLFVSLANVYFQPSRCLGVVESKTAVIFGTTDFVILSLIFRQLHNCRFRWVHIYSWFSLVHSWNFVFKVHNFLCNFTQVPLNLIWPRQAGINFVI